MMQGCWWTISPHENFKAHHATKVGRKVDDPDLIRTNYTNPRDLISTREMPSGIAEMTFGNRGTCRVTYQVDGSKTIVGWRYEGSERDCAIVP